MNARQLEFAKKASKARTASLGEVTLAMQMRALKIEYSEEYRFHPKRRWRFDFAITDRMIAIEVEGGHWSNGRHTRGKGFEDDCEKYSEAACLGWRLIRVTTSQVKNGMAIAWIRAAIAI